MDILKPLGNISYKDAAVQDEEVLQCIQDAWNYLSNGEEEICSMDEQLRPLSERQVSRAFAAVTLLETGKTIDALHELYDAVDDYGRADNRFISANEKILYRYMFEIRAGNGTVGR